MSPCAGVNSHVLWNFFFGQTRYGPKQAQFSLLKETSLDLIIWNDENLLSLVSRYDIEYVKSGCLILTGSALVTDNLSADTCSPCLKASSFSFGLGYWWKLRSQFSFVKPIVSSDTLGALLKHFKPWLAKAVSASFMEMALGRFDARFSGVMAAFAPSDFVNLWVCLSLFPWPPRLPWVIGAIWRHVNHWHNYTILAFNFLWHIGSCHIEVYVNTIPASDKARFGAKFLWRQIRTRHSLM